MNLQSKPVSSHAEPTPNCRATLSEGRWSLGHGRDLTLLVRPVPEFAAWTRPPAPYRGLRVFLLVLGGLAAGLAGPLSAAPPPALEPAGPFAVESVVDGDTLVLADGRQVRLVGIQAPKLPLGRDGFQPWPLADEAKQSGDDDPAWP